MGTIWNAPERKLVARDIVIMLCMSAHSAGSVPFSVLFPTSRISSWPPALRRPAGRQGPCAYPTLHSAYAHSAVCHGRVWQNPDRWERPCTPSPVHQVQDSSSCQPVLSSLLAGIRAPYAQRHLPARNPMFCVRRLPS